MSDSLKPNCFGEAALQALKPSWTNARSLDAETLPNRNYFLFSMG